MSVSNPFEQINEKLDGIKNEIEDLKRRPERESKKLLLAQEAAKFLGIELSTIYKKSSEGTIPTHKQNNRLYFDQEELIQWVKNQ